MTINWKDWSDVYGTSGQTGDNFNGKIQAYVKDLGYCETDKHDYAQKLQYFSDKMKHASPEEALMYFFYFIFSAMNPDDHATMLGLFDDKVGAGGDSMGASAYLGKLNNLITNLLSDTESQDPTKGGVPVDQQLDTIAAVLDALKNRLSQADVQSSIDSSTLMTIETQIDTIRSNIYVNGATPPAGTTGYFTTNAKDPNGFHSFDEMKKYLGQKGDFNGAAEAAKRNTDATSIITSSVQNLNSAYNEQMGQLTGTEKSIQSFASSFMKSIIDLMNAVIQNAVRN